MTHYRCPNCGVPLALPEPPQKYHTRLLSGPKLENFDFSAQQHFGGKQEHTAALPAMAFAPGEKREQRTYRKLELGDVRTYLGLASATGLALGLASFATWGAFQVSWLWPLAVMFDAIATVWMVFVYRAFDDDKAIESVNEHERYPDMPPVQQPTSPPIRVEGVFQSQKGHVKRQSTIQLSCDPQCWKSFCRDVDGGRCNFSGRAAQDHGLTPDEWTEALTKFHLHKWLASLGDDRVAPSLNRAGRWVVRQFATN